VSRFIPTSISIEQTPSPDPQASAVLNALSRPLGAKQSWGVLKTLILGVASFGVIPLFAWIKGFYKFTAGEQQQFVHLARWVRENTSHPQARELERHANRLKPIGFITFLSVIAMLGTIAMMAWVIDSSGRPPEHSLLAGTYGFHKHTLLGNTVWPFKTRFANADTVFGIWIGGMSIAYALHWLQITFHAASVKSFVARFSQIAQAEGVNRVSAYPLGSTIRPLWLAAAVCMSLARAPWGILLMLAGAAQRRYITHSGRNTRAEVAQRLRALIERRRPGVVVPSPVYLRDRCIEPKCRAELPRGANFCRRCGTRQKAMVDRVA